MTAPTQVFPPWLTPVPFTTEVDGVQVVETSIKFLPLTYFGPSIPLGSVFTFGGSTFPPTVIFGPQSTSTSTSPASSTPLSSTSSEAPSTSATTLSPTSSISLSRTSTTPSVSSTHAPAASSVALSTSHGIGLGTKLAIALSIVLVALLLLVLLLVFLKVRRRRSLRPINRFSDSDWQIVGTAGDVRDNAARSGETEVLLPEERVMRHRASVSSTPILTPFMRTAYQPVASTSAEPVPRTSQNSSGSAAEGIESSTSQPASLSTIAPSALFYNAGRSRGDITRKSDEHVRHSGDRSDGSGNYARLPPGASPPLLPPRSYLSYLSNEGQFISPGVTFDVPPRQKSRHHSTESLPYPESPASEVDERATLLTAQRVDLGPQVAVSAVPHRRSSPDDNPESPTLSSAGLSGLIGLNRFSWFRRMQNRPQSTSWHSSPPLNPVETIHRTSSFNRLSFHPASRPHSENLYPGHDSRPTSDFNFLGLTSNELGLRPPTAHFSAGYSSGSRGSGSGSGQSVYHSATSRSQSFRPPSGSELPQGHELIDLNDADLSTPAAPAEATIRTVDVLDMPVPEPTWPLQAASPDNVVSRGSSPRGSPRFPPGLVAIPRWDSEVSSSQREDVLDQAPPRSPDEWSSMKSKRSFRGVSPIERAVETEHNVEVTSIRGPTSEEAVVEPGSPSFLRSPIYPVSPTSPGFSLTPRVSLYAPSEHISHNSGSHSSRGRVSVSEHTTFSHETHASHNEPFSDDDYFPPVTQRASLSAIGGNRVRRKASAVAGRVLPAPEERLSEEEKSKTGSRPGSVVSGGTASETVVSGSTSNPIGQKDMSIIDMLQSLGQKQ